MPFSDVIPEHTINSFLLRCQPQWELSICHSYVASTLAPLHHWAIRIYSDFKLFHPNNKLHGFSVQPFFFFFHWASLPFLFWASVEPAIPLLIGYESFMGFGPFCLLQAFWCPRYQTYIPISFSQWLASVAALFIVCFLGPHLWHIEVLG